MTDLKFRSREAEVVVGATILIGAHDLTICSEIPLAVNTPLEIA